MSWIFPHWLVVAVPLVFVALAALAVYLRRNGRRRLARGLTVGTVVLSTLLALWLIFATGFRFMNDSGWDQVGDIGSQLYLL
jgi:formate hydrogenlyase subunit 3/multisubunit Na+/H+ antiporter MnhD subunit